MEKENKLRKIKWTCLREVLKHWKCLRVAGNNKTVKEVSVR